jgi:hypothetical protein
MPSTADQVNKFANRVVQSVKYDGENPLWLLVQIRGMEKAFKIITEKIQENLLNEAEKYPERKFEFMGNEIEKAELATVYDYSKCGHPDWEQFSVAEKTAAEGRKATEAFLRALTGPIDLLDRSTGEVTLIMPPTKKSTSGLKVFIK